MNSHTDKNRLSQQNNLTKLFQTYSINDMITVYFSNKTKLNNYGIYCALISQANLATAMKSASWDLCEGGGTPSGAVYYNNGKKEARYHRFGNNDGTEPLVLIRQFSGMYQQYIELNEEFRLFHNLYHDRKTNSFIKITKAGDEDIIGIVEENSVQIRLKEIKQFLAIKEMNLLIQFDIIENSNFTLEQLELSIQHNIEIYENKKCYQLGYGEYPSLIGEKSFSRLLGKRSISALPKEKSGIYGFSQEEQKKFCDFIIKVTENGDEIYYTSNPDELANFFGANPEAPNYLTPVYFKKTVLDKYFNYAKKYSVSDSILRCGTLWSLQIDNHHEDKVCVWLGDLGRDLPYEEQLYWKSFNIPPKGGISEVYFKRQIMAEPTDSEQAEHKFSYNYSRLNSVCANHLGWQIFIPLAKNDEYHLKTIRVTTSEEQKDFDEQILSLTKLLIDSINEKQLNKLTVPNDLTNLKGSISKLEFVLKVLSIPDFEEHINFLRNLQSLRSSSSAHRKGTNYKIIAEKFEMSTQSNAETHKQILQKANLFIEFIIVHVEAGAFKSSENE